MSDAPAITAGASLLAAVTKWAPRSLTDATRTT
jgi:hypothetical protein